MTSGLRVTLILGAYMFRQMWKKARIKRKLLVINLLTTGVTLVLTGSALLLAVYFSLRDSLVDNLSAQAKVLAGSSSAPLVFNDPKQAAEDLRALKASPNIVRAVIYNRNGRIFAEYWRDGLKKDSAQAPRRTEGYLFSADYLHLYHGIVLDRETVGTIYLRSDLWQLHSLMLQYGVITVLTTLIVFIFAFLLLTRLQRGITGPIFNLAQTMRVVSRDRNYALRAEVAGEDEMGVLAKVFNEMLEQIQERDGKLRTEISERSLTEDRLRQAKEEWDRTFDAIVDPIMIVNADLTIKKANRAMAGKLGVTPAEAEGMLCCTSVHGSAGQPLACPHARLLKDGQPHSAEIYEERLGGHFIVSVSPLFDTDGKVTGSVHYARDINDRIRAEESIRKLNEGLEQKVRERTRQLLDAQDELVRKEKLATLGQLSGSVGHELRNPLGVMSNALYFLNTVMTDADETVKEYLEIIRQEIVNCQRIISDLLDFARVKTPQTRVVSVGDLVADTLRRCTVPETVLLDTDIPETLPKIAVDPQQMGQVFENLVTNAVQAMPEGGALRISARETDSGKSKVSGSEPESETRRPDVTATATNVQPEIFDMKRGGYFIEIFVTDTGEGISDENMKKLFQPLFTTKARGIGLGLTVCRNLTEANGGRIEVESRLGEGTTFAVTLPVERGGTWERK